MHDFPASQTKKWLFCKSSQNLLKTCERGKGPLPADQQTELMSPRKPVLLEAKQHQASTMPCCDELRAGRGPFALRNFYSCHDGGGCSPKKKFTQKLSRTYLGKDLRRHNGIKDLHMRSSWINSMGQWYSNRQLYKMKRCWHRWGNM